MTQLYIRNKLKIYKNIKDGINFKITQSVNRMEMETFGSVNRPFQFPSCPAEKRAGAGRSNNCRVLKPLYSTIRDITLTFLEHPSHKMEASLSRYSANTTGRGFNSVPIYHLNRPKRRDARLF